MTRRRWLVASLLLVLFLGVVAVLLLTRGGDLRSRSAQIAVGTPRAEVEDLLGPPVLVMRRSGGRGNALAWVDQFWQVTVYTDADGRAESVECVSSNSLYRQTIGRLVAFP